MTIRGVDTTDRSLTGAILARNGYAFACRYVRNAPVASPTDKQWTRDEVAEKSAAGVRVVPNFEFGERPANSKATGRAHANIFLEELDSVGGPGWSPCYFSADYPAQPHDLDLYYEGIADTIGPGRSGAYTNGALFRQLKADGLITLAWQSMSKSYPGNHDSAGRWDHRGADIIQTGRGSVAGHDCDFNTAVIDLYGGWLLGEEDPTMAFTLDEIATAVVNKLKADPSDLDLKWRVHAIANALDTYAAGSMKGDSVGLTRRLAAIPTVPAATPAAIAAAVVAELAPVQSGGVTVAQVEQAVAKVLTGGTDSVTAP